MLQMRWKKWYSLPELSFWVESMIKAGKKASESKTPIILDPVGSGATSFRTSAAKRIIQETRVSVIRGNASEILSLRQNDSKTKGVDSIHSVEAVAESAKILANELESVIAVTGPTDLITDGKQVIRVSNGHLLMGYITGTGCTATATIGAFLSVDEDPVSATATALAFFGLAGEVAAKNAFAPGSFMISMLDALYTITPEELLWKCKFEDGT
jgi:hydroxyethylthiazole kinase